MEQAQASGTAIVAAIMRAAHPAFDDEPWIFEDRLAAPLAGIEGRAALGAAIDALRARIGEGTLPVLIDAWSRSTRLCPAVRARYAEDRLADAIERGVSQYVILGAGLDSYAYRAPNGAAAVTIFEVDQPATQRWKRARLAELGIAPPPNLMFAPVDFERETILDAIEQYGFDADRPAFFSWLGVTFFLTDDAIDSTFRQVAATAAGSELVFDYVLPDGSLDEEHRRIAEFITSVATVGGETGGHRFGPAALAARVEAAGFSRTWQFSPDDADRTYFHERRDGLKASRLFQFMRAVV